MPGIDLRGGAVRPAPEHSPIAHCQIVAQVTGRWDGWRIVGVAADELWDYRNEFAEARVAASTLDPHRGVLSGSSASRALVALLAWIRWTASSRGESSIKARICGPSMREERVEPRHADYDCRANWLASAGIA